MKKSYIISGGTFVRVAPHFALSAPAFGKVGRELIDLLPSAYLAAGQQIETKLILTRMALGGNERAPDDAALFLGAGIDDLVTNDDLEQLIDHLLERQDTAAIVMASAACDFKPAKTSAERFSSLTPPSIELLAEAKIIRKIRRFRKDVFLVGFKTTAGKCADDQYLSGLHLLKTASCNLVLANDLNTRLNMVITPEQARYHETTDRDAALRGLSEMTALRSKLKFTRAKVVPGEPVAWSFSLVPASLRAVVDRCIDRGAYKPFLNATVGHFAVKVDEHTILTSRRKTDFNKLSEIGLVKVVSDGEDSVVAFGSKPSVGGQSQRIIFKEHPGMDCIVHFHCPLKPGSKVPMRSQREVECGSHECGRNTSTGLARFGNLLAVMLNQHGPNIVFPKDIDPAEVLSFIEANFELEGRTDRVPTSVWQAYASSALTAA
jgi:hypothetical protein